MNKDSQKLYLCFTEYILYLQKNILWLIQDNFIKVISNHYFHISIILQQSEKGNKFYIAALWQQISSEKAKYKNSQFLELDQT